MTSDSGGERIFIFIADILVGQPDFAAKRHLPIRKGAHTDAPPRISICF
ncbi:hypothetical protein [Rosistilla ulvae]|nr:hypothetical protein [Rosistilla ulvae]